MSVIEYWDNMYRGLSAPVAFSGGQPSAEVVEAARRLSVGARVLDLGCGDGRNALFLAASGFDVTASDISAVAVAKVQQFSAERDLVIRTLVQDFRDLSFEAEYDLIVSMGCLHLIARQHWHPLLRRIQQYTAVGGYNAVGVMTDALPAPEDQREHFVGLFAEGELYDCYADWEVITRRDSRFHDEHPGDIRHHHAGNTVLARKTPPLTRQRGP
jgi:tellurite methyltransferase